MPKWVKYLIREFQPSKVKNYLTAGTPRPKTVGFRDLVGVAIAPVPKKLAVKNTNHSSIFLVSTSTSNLQTDIKYAINKLKLILIPNFIKLRYSSVIVNKL